MKTLYILPNEKLDRLLAVIASTASFGTVQEGGLSQEFPSIRVCFADLRSSFTMMADIAVIADALLALRTIPVGGLDLVALEVVWVNIPDAKENPFGDTGFFRIRAHAHQTPDTQP